MQKQHAPYYKFYRLYTEKIECHFSNCIISMGSYWSRSQVQPMLQMDLPKDQFNLLFQGVAIVYIRVGFAPGTTLQAGQEIKVLNGEDSFIARCAKAVHYKSIDDAIDAIDSNTGKSREQLRDDFMLLMKSNGDNNVTDERIKTNGVIILNLERPNVITSLSSVTPSAQPPVQTQQTQQSVQTEQTVQTQQPQQTQHDSKTDSVSSS